MEVSITSKNSVRLAVRSAKIVVEDNKLSFPGTNDLIIDGPGEYEVKGMMVTGVPVGEDTAYVIHSDSATAGILTNVVDTLSGDALEQLSELDVLLIAAEGYEIIGKLEPKYVIPLGSGDPLKKFLDEMGATAVEPVAKLKVTGRDVPEETTVAVLTPGA